MTGIWKVVREWGPFPHSERGLGVRTNRTLEDLQIRAAGGMGGPFPRSVVASFGSNLGAEWLNARTDPGHSRTLRLRTEEDCINFERTDP